MTRKENRPDGEVPMLRRHLGRYVRRLLVVLFAVGAAALAAQKKLPAAPVDLNSATVEQLQQLPTIGPSMAKAIVRFREKSGPFQRVEDLLVIRGISKARLERLRPYVIVVPRSSVHASG